MAIKESNLEEPEERDYSLLYSRVIQMRMQELFSEPYDGDLEEEE